VNENNIQITELRIHIIDLPDFKSTTLTKNKAYRNLEKESELDVENKNDTKRKRLFILLIYSKIMESIYGSHLMT
jgi:hypothetical protein